MNTIIGTLVWTLVIIISCIIYIKTVICSWIFLLYPTEYHTDYPLSLTPIEGMTKLVSKYNFCEEIIDISGVKIHYVTTDNLSNTEETRADNNILVFIHGTASCCVTFFDIMKVLSITHRQKCVAIDLPMFGISGHIDIERYKTNQELCECYADVIGNTLQKLGIVEDTVLVAHSLGGFLSIYVADRFPIKKLVLLNPAGILPTLGELGYYWGMFFKMGLPTTAFHLPLVSSDGLINIGKVMYGGGGGGSIANVDDITNFWLSFYSNPNNEGHRIVQRLITLRPFYSYWNTPAFTTLMDVYKNVPTSICFGVSDTVCPSHIGSFLRQLTQDEIIIHNIQNANHNPCTNIACMVDFLVSISNNTYTKIPKSWRNRLKKHNNIYLGYSYHLLQETQESFQNVYDYLLTHNNL